MKRYIAHKTDNGEVQSVREHLMETSNLCNNFSVDMFKEYASLCGLLHDIGKYSKLFQERINGKNIRVCHADCGAYEIIELTKKTEAACWSFMIAYCIAGHHSGLHDGGTRADNADDKTLYATINRKHEEYLAYKNEISVVLPDFLKLKKYFIEHCRDNSELIELYAFVTKYLFSCLTDADFIDTEKFCNPNIKRGLSGDFEKALLKVNTKLSAFVPDSKVNSARNRLQVQAIKNMAVQSNLYLLNMPTGSGKTLCSMKIALERVISGKKKRIIYVIPYTSIIEQTAEVFEKMFGDDLPVLQHYSNYSFDEKTDNENDNTSDKLKRACENWDAPFIITTNVQFFQSIYHYKGSRLRKLHNLADSIIVFDEIHMMPVNYIQPCLRAIGYITKHLSSEAIFMSATMPDFTKFFKSYLPLNNVRELITDKSSFQEFKNCDYTDLGWYTVEKIVEKSSQYQCSLIIVNSRSRARKLFTLCSGKKYHLSTYMTSEHRSEIIREIRTAINCNEKITVISTSLIEAGVDLDFEAVFRELSGLDSILQSAGRCNREGRRKKGYMYIFELSDFVIRNPDIKLRMNITRNLLGTYADITAPECIREYYDRLFSFSQEQISKNCISGFNGEIRGFDAIPFRGYAESFHLIDSDTINIVIPERKDKSGEYKINRNQECMLLIERLKQQDYSVKRRLQLYCASVHFYEYESLLKYGVIDDYRTGVMILTNPDYYDSETGLDPDKSNNYIA
jgi:CRISPR-associated endonuclease/helicase Cas3